MSFDHDELGIDLDRVATLPECAACRKKSDGAKTVTAPDGKKTTLCGTHYDEWLTRRYTERVAPSAEDFARELRIGKFKPCWDAKIDD
jgi:hypothetical protein